MADAAPVDATTAATEQPPYSLSAENQLAQTVIFIVLLFFIFYFVLLRPQQQRAKAHARLLESVAKGSRIVTGGGILGTVVKMEDGGIAQVEIASGVKVRVMADTISGIAPDGGKPAGTANDN